MSFFALFVLSQLQETFANTPLFTPLQSFISCIIGQKVAGIEKALTWIHDNAEATFPTVSPNVLMLDSSRSQELVAPVKDAALGDGTQDNQGLVPRLVNSYAQNLKRERIMFLIFIGIYVLIFLIGTLIALWNGVGRRKWQEKKMRNLEDDSGHVSPFQQDDTDSQYLGEKSCSFRNLGYGTSDQEEKSFTASQAQAQQPQTWPNSHHSNSFLSFTSSNNDTPSPITEQPLQFPSMVSPRDEGLPLPPNQRFEAIPRTSTSTPDSHFFRSRSVTPAQAQSTKVSTLWRKAKEGVKGATYWWFYGKQTPAQMDYQEKSEPQVKEKSSEVGMTESESNLALSRDVPTETNLTDDGSVEKDLHSQIFRSDQNARYPHHHPQYQHFSPVWATADASRGLDQHSQRKEAAPPRPLPTPPSSSSQQSCSEPSTSSQSPNPEIKRPIPQFAMDRDSILGSRNRRISQSSSPTSQAQNQQNRFSLSNQRKSLKSSSGFSPLKLKNRDPSLRFRTLSSVAEVRESLTPQASPRKVESGSGEESALKKNRESVRDHILHGSAF